MGTPAKLPHLRLTFQLNLLPTACLLPNLRFLSHYTIVKLKEIFSFAGF